MSPLCESYVSAEQLNQMEAFYPLHVRVCGQCFLVQLEEYVSAVNIFSDYAYFSSYSDSWIAHAKAYAEQMTSRYLSERRAAWLSRLPATMAICFSISSPKRFRCSGSNLPRTSLRWRSIREFRLW